MTTALTDTTVDAAPEVRAIEQAKLVPGAFRAWAVGDHYVTEWCLPKRLTCTCPHFTHRLAGVNGAACKHILAVTDDVPTVPERDNVPALRYAHYSVELAARTAQRAAGRGWLGRLFGRLADLDLADRLARAEREIAHFLPTPEEYTP